MSYNKNKKPRSISAKPVQPRYIMLNEDIFDSLNIYETSVYLALRYHADYRQECSDVEISINQLIQESKVKRRMLFHCLNTLENNFFLIRRLNWERGTFGKTNEYEVAQHLNYFKSEEIEDDQNDHVITNDNNNDQDNGSYIEGVHPVHEVVHHMHTVVHPVHPVVHEGDGLNKPQIVKFDDFWNIYPLKKAKKRCEEIWKRRKLHTIGDQIIGALQNQIDHDDHFRQGFIPLPSTWLNQDRWTDEIAKPISQIKSELPKKETKPDALVIYSGFINELKLMKQFKEIPEDTRIPSFEEWQTKGITADAKIFKQGLNLGR